MSHISWPMSFFNGQRHESRCEVQEKEWIGELVNSLLVAGCLLLVAGCLLLVACCWLLVACCLLLVACCLLLVACCGLAVPFSGG